MTTTRRDFAKVVALVPVAALAEEAPKAAPLASAMTEVVRAQSGAFLDDADLQRVATDFHDSMSALERLRAFPLANSDEPDVTFAAGVRRW